MFLICGLGNPGKNYKNTRHNVGFNLADNIISYFNLDKIKEDKIKTKYLNWKWNGLYGVNTQIKDCYFVHFFLSKRLNSNNVKELLEL